VRLHNSWGGGLQCVCAAAACGVGAALCKPVLHLRVLPWCASEPTSLTGLFKSVSASAHGVAPAAVAAAAAAAAAARRAALWPQHGPLCVCDVRAGGHGGQRDPGERPGQRQRQLQALPGLHLHLHPAHLVAVPGGLAHHVGVALPLLLLLPPPPLQPTTTDHCDVLRHSLRQKLQRHQLHMLSAGRGVHAAGVNVAALWAIRIGRQIAHALESCMGERRDFGALHCIALATLRWWVRGSHPFHSDWLAHQAGTAPSKAV